jgi:hypothetical protein
MLAICRCQTNTFANMRVSHGMPVKVARFTRAVEIPAALRPKINNRFHKDMKSPTIQFGCSLRRCQPLQDRVKVFNGIFGSITFPVQAGC